MPAMRGAQFSCRAAAEGSGKLRGRNWRDSTEYRLIFKCQNMGFTLAIDWAATGDRKGAYNRCSMTGNSTFNKNRQNIP